MLIEEKQTEQLKIDKQILEDKVAQLKDVLLAEQKDKQRIIQSRNKILKARMYYKFCKGKCIYVWEGPVGSKRHKVGYTADINERLRAERTDVPDLRLVLLIYSNDAELMEKSCFCKFRDKLLTPNHEVIVIDQNILINFIRDLVVTLSCEYTEEKDLWKYNVEDPPEE